MKILGENEYHSIPQWAWEAATSEEQGPASQHEREIGDGDLNPEELCAIAEEAGV